MLQATSTLQRGRKPVMAALSFSALQGAPQRSVKGNLQASNQVIYRGYHDPGKCLPWSMSDQLITSGACSGIGRTGTFCAVDIALQRLRSPDYGAAVSAAELKPLVAELRRQRGVMVQTPEQYHFCYQVLRIYCPPNCTALSPSPGPAVVLQGRLRAPLKVSKLRSTTSCRESVGQTRQDTASAQKRVSFQGFVRSDVPAVPLDHPGNHWLESHLSCQVIQGKELKAHLRIVTASACLICKADPINMLCRPSKMKLTWSFWDSRQNWS